MTSHEESDKVTELKVTHWLEEIFGDQRLERQGEMILEALKQTETAILHQCFSSHAEGLRMRP